MALAVVKAPPGGASGLGPDWQLGCSELKQRGGHLLTTGQWADCEFMVGAEPHHKIVKAHKLVLASASPVFEAMFFGGMAEGDGPIKILDVHPEAFKILLLYIYTDKTIISSFDKACSVYYAARKYMLPYLVKECTWFISLNLDAQNVCKAYELAQLFDENLLIEKCLKIMENHTREILADDSFIEADLKTVQTILSLEHLNIESELDLFNAVERYARVHLKSGQYKRRTEVDLLCSSCESVMKKTKFTGDNDESFNCTINEMDSVMSITEDGANRSQTESEMRHKETGELISTDLALYKKAETSSTSSKLYVPPSPDYASTTPPRALTSYVPKRPSKGPSPRCYAPASPGYRPSSPSYRPSTPCYAPTSPYRATSSPQYSSQEDTKKSNDHKTEKEKDLLHDDEDRNIPCSQNSSMCSQYGSGNMDRRALAATLGRIRFLTLPAAQFAAGPARSPLLRARDAFAVLMNILKAADVPMPAGFSTSRLPRNQVNYQQTLAPEMSDSKSEAVFRFTVLNFKTRRRSVESRPFVLHDAPWTLRLVPRVDADTSGLEFKYFGIYLKCAAKEGKFSWRVKADIQLLPQAPAAAPVTGHINKVFTNAAPEGGIDRFVSWETVLGAERGLLKNNAIVIEATISADRQ